MLKIHINEISGLELIFEIIKLSKKIIELYSKHNLKKSIYVK